jgi:hypothetical protein
MEKEKETESNPNKKSSIIGAKNGNPTIAKNGEPNQNKRVLNRQEWRTKKYTKTLKRRAITGEIQFFPVCSLIRQKWQYSIDIPSL